MRRPFFFLNTIFLAFFLCSCKNESINFPEILTLSQWRELKIENYQYEQKVVCFCAPPAGRFHRITVENAAIVEIVDVEDGSSLPREDYDFFKTISELLEFAESINPGSVALFNVEYDSVFGFPGSIYVDFDQRIADEEIGYETRNFKRN